MQRNEARDNRWTAEKMTGEGQETERRRDGVRDLESRGVKKSDPRALPILHFSRSD